jgi:ATP-dependent exoDNAse (exonuclease V) beta subunit
MALRPLALEALAQGGSLTWVGDVKQAIYRWRGGDAALFDALLRDPGLLSIVPEPHCRSLPDNWRSREEIVKFNNALFSLLASPAYARSALDCLLPEMPHEMLVEAANDVSRTFTDAGQSVPDRPDSRGGFVRVFPIEGEDTAEIESAVREELEKSIEGIAARRAWKDIAILTRSNEQAASAAAWLMEMGVPVLTENSLVLAEHPLVQQSIAFVRFVHNPLDQCAFWELCTAPLCTDLSGLSREFLHAWAARRASGALHLRFRDEFPEMWAQFFAPFFPCGLMSPYDLLQEFFSRFKMMERFPGGAAFLRRLLEVAHAAEGQGHASLASFLDTWAQGGMEEKLPMPEGMDAVRVMTIHKAKGLGFPVVIIPGTRFSLRSDNPRIDLALRLPGDDGATEEDVRLRVPRCKEMGAAHWQALAAYAREMLHLLYVAFTRATD